MEKVDKTRFDRIKNEIQNAKDKNKFVIPGRSGNRINANDLYQLFLDKANGGITHEEALNKKYLKFVMTLKDLMSWQRLIRIKSIC